MERKILPTTEELVTAKMEQPRVSDIVSTAVEKYQRKKRENNRECHITHMPDECIKFKASYSQRDLVVMI